MRDTIRRRLSAGDGMSLVEVLVALGVLSIVLLAVLQGLLTSSASVYDQRLRSTATRVATQAMEEVRAVHYDDVPTGSETEEVVAEGGETFTLERTVRGAAATDLATAGDDVKVVTTTVSWDARGRARSSTFETVLTPDDVFPVQDGIITVFMDPDPATINMDPAAPPGQYGHPTRDVEIYVTLNYEIAGFVQVHWRDASGGPMQTRTLAKTATDEDVTLWRGSLPPSDVYRPVAEDEEDATLSFTIGGGALSTVHSLRLERGVPDPPTITAATITPNPVTVEREKGHCHQDKKCTNLADVALQVRVTDLGPPGDEAADAVRVKFLLYDGTASEVSMLRDTADPDVWRVVIPKGTTKFLAGPSQPFVFEAIRKRDGAKDVHTVNQQVNAL